MRCILLILIIGFLNVPTFAQEVWDLEKCLSYAIEHSIDIQQSDYQIDDAAIQTKISESQRYPSLNAGISTNWNSGRTVDPTTNDFNNATFFSNGYQVNSGVLLYGGGRLKKSIEQSRVNESAADADKSSIINTITLNVVGAYFEVLFAKDNLSNAQVQLKTIRDQIDQMQKMVEAGSRAQFEIYDLEAQQATADQQITLAENRIDLGFLNLKGLMNFDPSSELDLAIPPVEQKVYSDPELSSFEEILERVVSSRPELRAYDLRLASAEKGVEIAESQLLPTLSFGVNFGTNYSAQAKKVDGGNSEDIFQQVTIDNVPALLGTSQFVPSSFSTIPYIAQIADNKSLGFGFSANIPIYNNYNTKGNIERSKINVLNQKAERDKYSINLRNTLGQLITDVKAAKRNLDAAIKVLSAREIAFENAEKRYNLGAINSFDYTSIQDQMNQGRTDQIIAKYDYMLKAKVLDFYQGYPVSLK
ncbi:MAG: outer membrane protein [Saprospiraceae bacterium]|jgi:outer membrane protein